MWEFNYGEWSEAYVFLRLLGTGRIYGADENFNKDPNTFLDVNNIIRYEKDHTLRFERVLEFESVQGYDNEDAFPRLIPYFEFCQKADDLFKEIRTLKEKKSTVSVPDIESYLLNLGFSQPKAPKMPNDKANQYGKKSDIIITVNDSLDHSGSVIGFSIKSHLNAASSLFNSAPSSNLRYEIVGCNDDIMNKINGYEIDSEVGMFRYIKQNPDLSLNFVDTSEEFKDNLDFIDPRMPKILSEIMLIQIGYLEKAKSHKTSDLVKKLKKRDPINARRPDLLYEAKIKEFLYDSFSGLTATELWDGRRRLSGGYIDVGSNGELLYYRAVSDDIFTSYLYNNTFFDRPSRGVKKDIAKVVAQARLEGREATDEEIHNVTYKFNTQTDKEERKSTKGDWGYVYKDKENKHYYININFQVRFK